MSARFVKLTQPEGEPLWLNLSLVEMIHPWEPGSRLVLPACQELLLVRETPEQILALLAEPAPSPSVEVTEAAVEAANDAWFADVPWRGQGSERDCRMIMRAAIEAALREMGLRP